MYKKTIADKFLDNILDAYKMEMEKENLSFIENDYAKGKAALDYRLNDEQKRLLSDIEASCQSGLEWAVRFGYFRGLYSGFQTEFTPTSAETFQSLVDDELKMPNMLRYPEYSEERSRAQKMYERLYGQLDDYTQEHLASIESAWDERLYGVLRHAFSIGFHWAISIADDVQHRKPGKIIKLKDL